MALSLVDCIVLFSFFFLPLWAVLPGFFVFSKSDYLEEEQTFFNFSKQTWLIWILLFSISLMAYWQFGTLYLSSIMDNKLVSLRQERQLVYMQKTDISELMEAYALDPSGQALRVYNELKRLSEEFPLHLPIHLAKAKVERQRFMNEKLSYEPRSWQMDRESFIDDMESLAVEALNMRDYARAEMHYKKIIKRLPEGQSMASVRRHYYIQLEYLRAVQKDPENSLTSQALAEKKLNQSLEQLRLLEKKASVMETLYFARDLAIAYPNRPLIQDHFKRLYEHYTDNDFILSQHLWNVKHQKKFIVWEDLSFHFKEGAVKAKNLYYDWPNVFMSDVSIKSGENNQSFKYGLVRNQELLLKNDSGDISYRFPLTPYVDWQLFPYTQSDYFKQTLFLDPFTMRQVQSWSSVFPEWQGFPLFFLGIMKWILPLMALAYFISSMRHSWKVKSLIGSSFSWIFPFTSLLTRSLLYFIFLFFMAAYAWMSQREDLIFMLALIVAVSDVFIQIVLLATLHEDSSRG